MKSIAHLHPLVAPAKAGAYDHYATLVGPGFRRGDGNMGMQSR
jgi:hypothetical protein